MSLSCIQLDLSLSTMSYDIYAASYPPRPRDRGHAAALPRRGEQGDGDPQGPGQGPHLVHARGGPEPHLGGHVEGERCRGWERR